MMKYLIRRMKGLMFKSMHGMISCREFEDFILSYLDGELSEKQSKKFEIHMRICRECRDYLAAYKRSMELNRAMFPRAETIPEDVPEDLIKAIIESRRV